MRLFSALYESHDPFSMFEAVDYVKSPEELTKDGVLMLHGGADISPTIYKHKVSKYCHADERLTIRDEKEIAFIKQAKKLSIPIIGICRGAQLLCALDGGHLVQHIVGHKADNHKVVSDQYGNLGDSNTAHHQMMQPRKSRSNTLIGYVNQPVYGYEQEDMLREYAHVPEVVHFGEYNALGIQGHPEWMKPGDKFIQNLRIVIKDYLLRK